MNPRDLLKHFASANRIYRQTFFLLLRGFAALGGIIIFIVLGFMIYDAIWRGGNNYPLGAWVFMLVTLLGTAGFWFLGGWMRRWLGRDDFE